MSKKRVFEEIVLSSDDEGEDEDADFRKAIQLSKQEAAKTRLNSTTSGASGSKQEQKKVKLEVKSEADVLTSTSGAAADGGAAKSRMEMEQERLARQAQRQQQGEAAGSSTSSYTIRPADAARRPVVSTISDVVATSTPTASTSAVASSSSGARINGFSNATANPTNNTTLNSNPMVRHNSNRANERFWNGEIRRTSIYAYPDITSFTFDQALGPKSELEGAVVGAYVTDSDWVVQHFLGLPTSLLIIMSAGSGMKPGDLLTMEGRERTFIKVPKERSLFQPGKGCMHTKVIMLFYSTFCRLVIPSANSIDFDWERIENALYIQDFPLYQNTYTTTSDNPTHTPFSLAFQKYFSDLGVYPRILAPFSKYDFSASGNVRLVWSSQGWWDDWDEIEKGGGLCSLAKAVKELAFDEGGIWEIECAGSSTGDYKRTWLLQMLAACQGIEPKSYFNSSNKEPRGLRFGPGFSANKLPIKIVYPTLAEVDASRGGRNGAHTLFFKKEYWKSPSKELLHQGRSRRAGIISHTKHILALRKAGPNPPPNFRHQGWLYIGSHNFTPSAWGNLSHNPPKAPKLGISNYECGVIVKLEGVSEADLERKASNLVTYQRPLVPYGARDKPWMQDVDGV